MESTNIIGKIIEGRRLIKEKRPLIHHITNYVTANDSANIALSIGASPVMADDIYEIKEVIGMANALVINIGTFEVIKKDIYLKAVELANKKNIPVVLDPVGAGAFSTRKEFILDLLDNYKINIIKGNAAEIKSIVNMPADVKGVDSEDISVNIIEAAGLLSGKYKTTVAVTGEKDIITDGKVIITVKNGDPLLAFVTGTGCMTASLIGAFCATDMNDLYAAVAGVLTMGIAGELAAKKSFGPGILRYLLMDEVYNINGNKYNDYHKIKSLLKLRR